LQKFYYYYQHHPRLIPVGSPANGSKYKSIKINIHVHRPKYMHRVSIKYTNSDLFLRNIRKCGTIFISFTVKFRKEVQSKLGLKPLLRVPDLILSTNALDRPHVCRGQKNLQFSCTVTQFEIFRG